MGDLISIGEAAERCGVHIETLRKWEQKGLLTPFYTTGGHRRYRLKDLEMVMNNLNRPPVNLFYESIGTDSKEPMREVDIFVGDRKLTAKIGRFETLLIV